MCRKQASISKGSAIHSTMSDLQSTFDSLRSILARHEDVLVVVKDEPGNYYLTRKSLASQTR